MGRIETNLVRSHSFSPRFFFFLNEHLKNETEVKVPGFDRTCHNLCEAVSRNYFWKLLIKTKENVEKCFQIVENFT